MKPTEPLNPITVQGWRSKVDKTLRCFTIGRLGIGGMPRVLLREGQHRLNINKPAEDIVWKMQFLLWENPQQILIFLGGLEQDFVPQIKEFKAGKLPSFRICGDENYPQGHLLLEREGDAGRVIITNQDKVCECCFEYDTFMRGLVHLFPHGELD